MSTARERAITYALDALINQPSSLLAIPTSRGTDDESKAEYQRLHREAKSEVRRRFPNGLPKDHPTWIKRSLKPHDDDPQARVTINVGRVLMDVVWRDLAERDLADKDRRRSDPWVKDWSKSAERIFVAYMTAGATPAAATPTGLDGVPLLRARMLAYSQHTDPEVRALLRNTRNQLEPYFELWREALKTYGRKSSDLHAMVRLLGGLLDGIVMDLSVLSDEEQTDQLPRWSKRFAKASVAILEAYTTKLPSGE